MKRKIGGLKVLRNGENFIRYFPSMTKYFGGVEEAIFFSQVMFRYESHRKPFYKFDNPCTDHRYVKGDSWSEELAFNKNQFRTTKKAIATKLTIGEKFNPLECNQVLYWRTRDRLSFYLPNYPKLLSDIESIPKGVFKGFEKWKAKAGNVENYNWKRSFLPFEEWEINPGYTKNTPKTLQINTQRISFNDLSI